MGVQIVTFNWNRFTQSFRSLQQIVHCQWPGVADKGCSLPPIASFSQIIRKVRRVSIERSVKRTVSNKFPFLKSTTFFFFNFLKIKPKIHIFLRLKSVSISRSQFFHLFFQTAFYCILLGRYWKLPRIFVHKTRHEGPGYGIPSNSSKTGKIVTYSSKPNK